MTPEVAGRQLTIAPTPTAHFGMGAIGKLGSLVEAAGGRAATIVTDAGMLATSVIDAVQGELDAAGIPFIVFSGVHANPDHRRPGGRR